MQNGRVTVQQLAKEHPLDSNGHPNSGNRPSDVGLICKNDDSVDVGRPWASTKESRCKQELANTANLQWLKSRKLRLGQNTPYSPAKTHRGYKHPQTGHANPLTKNR